jgi:hypothetical protein
MRFVVDVSDNKVLLTYDQLEKLSALLCEAESMQDKWVGPNKGTTGSGNAYLTTIQAFNPIEQLDLKPVSDEQVEAIKFVQKQQEKSA